MSKKHPLVKMIRNKKEAADLNRQVRIDFPNKKWIGL
jgi:hypothetical protein